MKKTLFSLAAMLCMATASMAQVTYTAISGDFSNERESYGTLFDNNTATKWCMNVNDGIHVIFQTSSPLYVWGFDFTTADDNENEGRTPREWTLYGANTQLEKDDAGWVELSHISTDAIQRKNYYQQRIFCNPQENAYQYFKFVINQSSENNGRGLVQLSELRLCGETTPLITYKWDSDNAGGASQKVADLDIKQKWEGNNFGADNDKKWFIMETTDGQPHALKKYSLTTHDDGNNNCQNRAPKVWSIEGSNDKSTWFSIDAVVNDPIKNENYKTFDFTPVRTDLAFRYIRFNITAMKATGWSQIAEFHALGGEMDIAEAAYSDYNYLSGDKAGVGKVFDKNSQTKGEGGDMPDGVKFIVETADGQPHTVAKYYMMTHDDGRWPNRAPKSWKLEGSNDLNEWATIDDVENGQIENVNYGVFAFVPKNVDVSARYLRMTINSFLGGYHQLAEFDVVGSCNVHDWELTDGKEPTCIEEGGAVYTCKKCGLQKMTGVKPATGIHEYDENGACVVCRTLNPTFVTSLDDFYLPTTVNHFTWLAAMIQAGNDVNIKLTQDVDLTGFAGFGNGDDVKPFKGEFDGQGHWLKNIHIDVEKKHTGLFGKVEGANIHDLGITGANVKSNQQNTAILVGNANNTTINRIAVKSSRVQGVDHVGSIAGNTESSTTISNILSDCEVVSTEWQAGGLVGTSNGLTLEKSLFLGSVSNAGGGGNAAGLISLLENGTHNISNNISAASLIYAQNRDVKPIAVPNGKGATYTNNHVAASSLFRTGNNEPATQNYNDVYGNEGLTTADRDMQCKSFLSTTMGWDMTNDWKMVAAGQWPVLAWMEVEMPVQTVQVSAAGYATFVAEADIETAENVYIAQNKGEYIHLEPVTSVPAGEAVVVAVAGEHQFPYAVDYAAATTGNDLVAATEDITADGSQYILAKPTGDEVGFYQATPSTTVAKGKAYIVIAGGAKAFYGFGENSETAISQIAEQTTEGAVIYNIAGQRVNKAVKGINIINGKKIIK